ncbi:hypothetical protein [Polaribacter sp.]|uniref:hypothetical protein n=1 Tax=Polaribacter sp. TaxID=1920175 RepID=UPI003F6A9620
MKKLLFFLFAIIFSSSYAQKDSIVTYLDAKGKIVTDLSKVYLVEILTKKTIHFGYVER